MTSSGVSRQRGALPGAAGEACALLREQAFIAGEWSDADSERTLTVADPATGAGIGCVPDMGAAETRRAIDAAAAAQPLWAALTAWQRGACLRRWGDLMREQREALAHLMTLEQGKPLAEARGEIDYAASFLTWFGEQGERLDGEVITSHLPGRKMFALRAPIGVTAAITPWNFPSAMVTRKAGAALAAGCAMIVRPASQTPFSALALALLAERSGIPPGVFQVITGSARAIAGELMSSATVRHVSFTGSTEVGRQLLAQGAATVKKMAMELGGHAPFIVCEDVDVESAVRGALAAKFQTSGQDCLAANRIFVARPIYDEFCARYAEAVRALKVGNGFEEGVDIGPLIDESAVQTCQAHVDDAVSKGARVLAGGPAGAVARRFFRPAVLADVTPDMRIFREETFGPVAALLPFDSDAEAVQLANRTEYGLAAYVFGRDLARLWQLAERLEYGMVAVNTVKMTGPPVPFGGVKQSGLGREGSRHGIEEYCEIKYLCVNGLGVPHA
ncbi:MAG TPA: NAD-dependent succinate-semialdehyde dehydrogenase [Steroidobacteraceae bacterium]|nr:NAD-dependent succinate-semialdehyde dehydrogenase [Steroidobacteraceae bacterium]